MIIINTQYGQLANRLWNFSTFIANSIEYNYTLINLDFTYKEYFEATKNNDFGGHPIFLNPNLKWLDRFYSKKFKNCSPSTYLFLKKTPLIYKFYCSIFNEDINHILININNKDFVQDAKTKKVFLKGWMYRDPINIRKYRDKLLEYFKPVEPYYSQVQQEIKNARKLADIIIGVHIRRGDFAQFVDGKWFYSDEQYSNWMHQLVKKYDQANKTCAFLITSNEDINLNNFKGLNIAFKQRHFIVDLYCLAECDAIIGPPSTFSQWAAFYGNKPLSMMVTANQEIEVQKLNPSLLPEVNFSEKDLYIF